MHNSIVDGDSSGEIQTHNGYFRLLILSLSRAFVEATDRILVHQRLFRRASDILSEHTLANQLSRKVGRGGHHIHDKTLVKPGGCLTVNSREEWGKLTTRERESQMVYLRPSQYEQLHGTWLDLEYRFGRKRGIDLEKSRDFLVPLLELGMAQLGDVESRDLDELADLLGIESE